MIRRIPIASAVALSALLMAGVTATGCDTSDRTAVVRQPTSEETSGTLTPVERGKVRREALDSVRAAIEAWKASDTEAMRVYLADDLVQKFEATWAPYEAKGQHIEHVHDLDYLDMIDLNQSGTQALVTYRYDDLSYVADESGAKVEDLPPFELKEIQFTLEPEDGEWKIIRAIAGEDAFR